MRPAKVTSLFPDRASLIIFVVWSLRSLPFLLLGFGSDYDAWRIAETADTLWKTGTYVPSRSLGFPLYELVVTPLIAVGSWIGSNLLSLAAGMAIFMALIRITRQGHFRHPRLVLVLVMFQPVLDKNAATTMDYLPALALMMWACVALLETRWGLAALLIGLSTGVRPTSILLLLPALLYSWERTRSVQQLFRLAATAAAVAAVACSPLLLAQQFSAPFLAPRSSLLQHAAMVGFHGLRFLGTAQTLLLLVIVAWPWRRHESEPMPAPLHHFHLGNLAVWGLLFLLLPDEPDYLLPALPSLVFLLDRCLDKRAMIAAVIVLLSYHGVQLELRSSNPDTMQIQPRLAAGYTFEDVQDRLFKLSLRRAAGAHRPAQPTVLMYGVPWITAANDAWEYEAAQGLWRLKEGNFYLAGQITDRQRILDLKTRGFRILAWQAAQWEYQRRRSEAWEGEVEIVADIRTLFESPVIGKALNER